MEVITSTVMQYLKTNTLKLISFEDSSMVIMRALRLGHGRYGWDKVCFDLVWKYPLR